MALPVTSIFSGTALQAEFTDTSGAGTDFIVGSDTTNSIRAGRLDHTGMAYWNADQFPDSQYCKACIAVGSLDAGHDIGVACRVQSGTADQIAHGYGFTFDGVTVYLYRVDGDGVYPAPPYITSSIGPLSLGTELRLVANSSQITGWVNSSSTLTFSDATYQSGYAGISGFSVSNIAVSSWEAGEFITPPPDVAVGTKIELIANRRVTG